MSKKCKDIELLLSSYLENELPKDEATSVAEHLDSCPQCLAKKEAVEALISRLPDLQEEVPFFLKNRLFNIPEAIEKKERPGKVLVFPKWLAAAVGTVILFLNLFYFTNIFPPMNREIHALVSSVEKLAVKTGGWFERIKESKELIFFTFFNKKSTASESDIGDQEQITGKGGKNG